MKINNLIGKTIESIYKCKLKDYDDTGYLHVTFTDGTKILIESTYGNWTSQSKEEYPTGIYISTATDEKMSKLVMI
jgi:hypothetical protein